MLQHCNALQFFSTDYTHFQTLPLYIQIQEVQVQVELYSHSATCGQRWKVTITFTHVTVIE